MNNSVPASLLTQLRPFVDAVPHAVVIVDRQERLVLVNTAAEGLFGYARDEVAGRPFQELVPRPTCGVRKDGSEFPIEVKTGPQPVEAGDEGWICHTIEDATERRRDEETLRDSEALFQSLVESLPLNVFRKDLEGRFLFANRLFCENVRKFPGELLGRTDHDLFPQELADKYRHDDRRVIESGRTFEDVEEHRDQDGRTCYVQVLKAPVRNGRGEIVGIQGMYWDVSERKRAEQARHESEARKRAIFEAALDCIVTIDHEGKIVEFNRAAERTFGYSRQEVIGREMDSLLFPPSWHERKRASVARYQTSREEGSMMGRRLEVPAVCKDGREFLAEMVMQPIPLRGQPAFTIFLRDITEQKRAEDALRRSDALFRSLVESNLIGIMICRLDGQVLQANDAFLRLVGSSRDELDAGRVRWDELTPPEYRHLNARARAELRRSGSSTPWEKEYVRPDGSRVPVLVGMVMLRSDPDDCLCFVLDMSRQKETERQLQAAKEAADTANSAKSTFLATMSHEIRTPMNAILGMTDLLLETRLAAQQHEYLRIVQDSAESLLSLINDVLDFSKVEAGKLESEEVEFDLRDAVGGAMKAMAIAAHGRGLELVSHVRPAVPERLVGDPTRFRQVLVNLVGNAIKFTETGEVVVRVDVASGTYDELRLHVSVADTGVGIREEQREHVFEPFEQLDSSMARRFGGTGLGLAISRRLVELMDGRIWYESEVGSGTTFHFTCRLRTVAGESDVVRPFARPGIRGARVLVVDDNAASRQALAEMLASWEMQPILTGGADEALHALAEASRSATPFHAILIDARMPDTNGFALAEEVRRLEGRNGTMVMMLVSGDHSADIARCDKLGVPAYLMKPVNQSELFDTLAAVLCDGEGEETMFEDAAAEAHRVRGLRVLLVEDSLYNQKLALAVLGKRRHQVTVANNGREAVEAVRRQSFELILMDVQMPEMDGLQATRAIRAREQETGEHVPIVAMTAQALVGDRERCLEAGMDAYLAKPVRADQLHAAIERLLADGGPARAPQAAAEATSRPPAGLVDWSVAWSIVGGDSDLLKDVSAAFLEEGPRRLDEIAQAIISADPATLRLAAHTLKGAVGLFGAAAAVEHALNLEQLARSGQLLGADRLFSALRQEIDGLLPEVSAFVQRRDAVGMDDLGNGWSPHE